MQGFKQYGDDKLVFYEKKKIKVPVTPDDVHLSRNKSRQKLFVVRI